MSGIIVKLKAGQTASSSSVSVTGSLQHVVTDQESQDFGVAKDSASLKNAVGKYFGKNPDNAYLKSPTPWDDLYRTYNWPQVITFLGVESYQILSVTSMPSVVSTQTFTNDSSHTASFDCAISTEVNDTVSFTDSSSTTVGFAQKVSYEFEFPGGKVGGETSFSLDHTVGHSETVSRSFTIGVKSGVTVPLAPHQSVVANLTANIGTMKARVVYKANLQNVCAVNYGDKYKGHHFYALDIGGVMNAGGLNNNRTVTEDITIGFFSNSQIVLSDNPLNSAAASAAAAASSADAKVVWAANGRSIKEEQKSN